MADELARPSTWKLLFGGNKSLVAANVNVHENNQDDRPEKSPQRHSPDDVSRQLWKALESRERKGEDDAIGRQCSDELLGKRNAFVPQLSRPEDAESLPAELSRDAKRQARNLINTRLKIDQQANTIRQGKTQTQQRRDDLRLRPSTTTTRPRGADAGTAERLKRLREIQKRREEFERAREQEQARSKQHEAVREKRHHHAAPTKTTARLKAAAKTSPVVSSSTTKKPQTVVKEPTATKPTARERGHQNGKSKTNQDNEPTHQGTNNPPTSSKPLATDHTNTNKSVPSARDLRVLEDKIRHLRAENQQVVALEEKLRAQQRLLLIKRRVWTIWHERIERRRLQETSVVRGFEWRLLQRLWAAWRSHARAAKRHRVAQQTREQLVLDKQQLETAARFYRGRRLVLWFQRWRAMASASREAKALEAEMQRRREKAVRLMERFASGELVATTTARAPPPPPSPPRSPRETSKKPTLVRSKPHEDKASRLQGPDNKPPPLPPAPPAKTTPAAPQPSPDAFYLSMQTRAEQRKAQREQLKLKYERLDQEKRDALARQVAEREALLERQRQDEKDRVREKKRQDARKAREQEARRHVAAVQEQSAALHDRLRLLFHYAWRPWQRAWVTSKRVARNTTAWRELRVVHRTWRGWISFVLTQRAQRRLREQEKMAAADDHFRRTLLRTIAANWKLAVRETQHKQVAVQRRVQWNETRCAWRCWRQAFVLRGRVALRREASARHQLMQRRLRSVLGAWREAAVEAARDRVRLAEKELLWKKARMWLND